MKASELKELINGTGLDKFSSLYSNIDEQKVRFSKAIDEFVKNYGDDRDLYVFSVPGRSEIMGNHTDHNRGCVLAGAIDRDIIAVVAKRDDGVIRFLSEGYPEDVVNISETDDPQNFKNYTSGALIAGTVKGFKNSSYLVGGFDAYTTSRVLKGSGISSSAAYEVMIGNIMNHLFNGGSIDNKELAIIAQYAENVYFGKPCGLMDQMACAVGGFVYIDFENAQKPYVEPIDFSLSDKGYSLCIVNTGGNHANLNDDYASVPGEMKVVAKLLGRDVLRGLTREDILKNINNIRRIAGDRAVLRTFHFLAENERVNETRELIKSGDIDGFFRNVLESGRSSFEYLQNVYTTINVKEQGLSLALALTDDFTKGKSAAYRVHGGGFAGTIQAFIKNEDVADYVRLMDYVFRDGATMPLHIRMVGATRLF